MPQRVPQNGGDIDPYSLGGGVKSGLVIIRIIGSEGERCSGEDVLHGLNSQRSERLNYSLHYVKTYHGFERFGRHPFGEREEGGDRPRLEDVDFAEAGRILWVRRTFF